MKFRIFILLYLLASVAKSQTFTDSNIPIVIIDTYNNTIVDEPKVASHFKLIDNGQTIAHLALPNQNRRSKYLRCFQIPVMNL